MEVESKEKWKSLRNKKIRKEKNHKERKIRLEGKTIQEVKGRIIALFTSATRLVSLSPSPSSPRKNELRSPQAWEFFKSFTGRNSRFCPKD